jgi:hypothetical protein
MNIDNRSPAASLYENTVRPAHVVKVFCQMIIGVGLAITLIVKLYMLVLTDQQCVVDVVTLGNKIRCSSTLEIAAYGLALSAGFELAFLMFRQELGDALRPLILGITSAFLLVLSDLSLESVNWQVAMMIFVLSLSVGGLLTFRKFFVSGTIKPENKSTGGNTQSGTDIVR